MGESGHHVGTDKKKSMQDTEHLHLWKKNRRKTK